MENSEEITTGCDGLTAKQANCFLHALALQQVGEGGSARLQIDREAMVFAHDGI